MRRLRCSASRITSLVRTVPTLHLACANRGRKGLGDVRVPHPLGRPVAGSGHRRRGGRERFVLRERARTGSSGGLSAQPGPVIRHRVVRACTRARGRFSSRCPGGCTAVPAGRRRPRCATVITALLTPSPAWRGCTRRHRQGHGPAAGERALAHLLGHGPGAGERARARLLSGAAAEAGRAARPGRCVPGRLGTGRVPAGARRSRTPRELPRPSQRARKQRFVVFLQGALVCRYGS